MKVRPVSLLVAIAAAMLMASATANAQLSANPSAQETEDARRKGPCRDPWITIAYWRATSGVDNPKGAGDVMECNPNWYRGGQWNSFKELYEAVLNHKNEIAAAGLKTVAAFNPKTRQKGFALVDGRGAILGGALIGMDGSSVISTDGSGLVAAGAGNVVHRLVAAGAGNLVAAGGGNVIGNDSGSLVAAGAGNVIGNDSGSLKSGGKTYSLKSAKRVITLPNRVKVYFY